jgi:periplasmic protein TonB
VFEHTMFADSMLETSWAQRTRRSWTTLTSFALEAVMIGLLLLLPLWRTVGLPSARTVSTPISAGLMAAEPAPRPRTAAASATQTNITQARVMQPSRIPTVIQRGRDNFTPEPPGGPGMGIEGTGFAPGTEGGLPIAIVGGIRPVLPTRPASTVHAFRTSNLLEGNLIRRISPLYPPLARSARIQGSVVLSALISKAGTMEKLRVLSGHPMLVPAAIEAVSQWHYRPYILNGEPVEVETQITVNFTLSGN